ncbi:DUF885 domain-containing protein [Aurantiacibacter gangjinensis]|uniref:DUF885 domain-containing protein n=1 Tax=Aurantiacibacter gangjinensis TaxID=502682 RepID=UPI0007ED9A73|nr:DUF885 domain-containing protein [Aurantiacibacter gangjinensis]APE28902.1 protein of unknown function DUF885 [Aurantiacibacter gangjinensis]
MIRHLLAASALAITIAAPAPAFAQDAEADFRELREDVWQWTLDQSPWLSEQVGDRRNDGQLGDPSLEGYEQRLEETRAFRARLDAIDAEALPGTLQIDHALMHRSFADSLEAATFDHSRYQTFTNRGGPQGAIASLPYSSPLFTVADYDSYLTRLESFPEYIATFIDRSEGAIERGLTQPCEPMQGYENSIGGFITDTPEESVWWQAFEERPSTITEEQWDRIVARGRTAITEGAFAGLEDFRDFYTQEFAPACRTDEAPGIGGTPGGQEYYAHRVRSFTTTDMTPQQIHELGLSEVARIRAEMEAVAAEAGFDTREAFIEHLRTDPQYYPTDGESYLEHTRALAKEIDGWMPRLFGTLPRLPYSVEPIPAAVAPGNTTAYYERGSIVTGQPGIYRLNLTELDQRPLWELPALGLHEAVPGHHHQIALQQELEIHPLRANGSFFTAFVEGWGLYAERLGIEMGLYDTPAKEMGRLSYEMWRANRLVVDTGLHAFGWTRQQAVDYMLDNTALSEGNINAEVNRYITWPGQALAYKVGELKIRELRTRAEERLGADFDLREFHDTLLENGAVPLDVLEAHVDRWIGEMAVARAVRQEAAMDDAMQVDEEIR